jgi:hypothetical protein
MWGWSISDVAWGAIGSFIVGAAGAWAALRHSYHDKENAFRDDILKLNRELRIEVNQLKDRVDGLEKELAAAWSENHKWELRFVKAKIFLLKQHNIDLDAWLKENP